MPETAMAQKLHTTHTPSLGCSFVADDYGENCCGFAARGLKVTFFPFLGKTLVNPILVSFSAKKHVRMIPKSPVELKSSPNPPKSIMSYCKISQSMHHSFKLFL